MSPLQVIYQSFIGYVIKGPRDVQYKQYSYFILPLGSIDLFYQQVYSIVVRRSLTSTYICLRKEVVLFSEELEPPYQYRVYNLTNSVYQYDQLVGLRLLVASFSQLPYYYYNRVFKVLQVVLQYKASVKYLYKEQGNIICSDLQHSIQQLVRAQRLIQRCRSNSLKDLILRYYQYQYQLRVQVLSNVVECYQQQGGEEGVYKGLYFILLFYSYSSVRTYIQYKGRCQYSPILSLSRQLLEGFRVLNRYYSLSIVVPIRS